MASSQRRGVVTLHRLRFCAGIAGESGRKLVAEQAPVSSSSMISLYEACAPTWSEHLRPVGRSLKGTMAVSQTSAVRGEGRRAVLAFPLELSLESISEPQDARPPL